MTYLLKRAGRYYYNRAVPELFRDLDPRKNIRIALNTDSRRQAIRKAFQLNDEIEAYWHSLANDNRQHDGSRFGQVVRVARRMGFTYQPMSVVAALPVDDLAVRVLALEDATPKQVEAVLGGRDEPGLTVRQALDLYWKLTKDKIINKTPDQVRKWRNPRIKAVESFIAVAGNKELASVTRDDLIAFKDWWIERVQNEDKNPGSANQDFIHLKAVFETVSVHLKLGLDIDHLFKKIKLEVRFKRKRAPFKSEQIITLLQSSTLAELNEQARWFLFAAAETGARPSELAGLLPEDIRLDDPVPHILITDRKERTLKNVHSARAIPLVGYALDAFKACPDGFPRYRYKPDSLTNLLNQFLRRHKLLPTERHTLYSFRHSFQDRLLRANAPDRVQTDLMGHRFINRIDYGDGTTLEHKYEWMELTRIRRCQTLMAS